MTQTLESGLILAVQPLPDSTVTSAHLWFEAGSADEKPEEVGAAHFVEHLLFKGTPSRGVGQVAAEIEGLGGDLNAWTSWDETCLHATVAADATDQALDVLFDMATRSVFDAEELERERLVVLEELRGYEDDPDAVAEDRLHARLFGNHPYGRPVVGTVDGVQGVSRDALMAFWRRHYHPGRAILAVAGPVDLPSVAESAGRLINGWQHGSKRRRIRAVRPRRGGRELVPRSFSSVAVLLGWPGPPMDHEDQAALDVLAHGLGVGAASRLQVALDLEGGLASMVWADASAWLAGGMFTVGFQCGDTQGAITRALSEMHRVVRSGLSAQEVHSARTGVLTDLLFATETTHGVASELVWSVARRRDPSDLAVYRKAVAAVTTGDVRRVAARWLDPGRAQVVVLDRALSTRQLSAAVRRAEPPATVPRTSRTLGRSTVHEVGGLRVGLLPDGGPLVGVQILAGGGQLLESARTAGLTEAWARSVVRGAGRFDSVALSTRLDEIGGRLDAGCGLCTQWVRATFPAQHLTEGLDLLGGVLLEPHFAADDWANTREAMLDDIAALSDDAAAVGGLALWQALWPKHPWRLPFLGTAASVSRTTPAKLAAVHTATMTAPNLVVALSGGFEPEEVLHTMELWAEHLPSALPPLPRPEAGAPRSGQRARRAGTRQAQVMWGARGVAATHGDALTLTVAEHLLDSQAGRLFVALRETRGLAYSVWARNTAAIGGGTFSAGLSTDPERAAEAASGLREVIATLAHEGPTPDELARTTRMLAGLEAMRLQRVSARALALSRAMFHNGRYGIEALQERLARITPADVQRALQALTLDSGVEITVMPLPDGD
ncbi:MAG: insulinase family protein [Myxococcales bacterium]|nr:insulinase family protein [Myxococcales bacterium]